MQLWNFFDAIILITLAICIAVWPTQIISDRQNRWLRIASVGLVAFQLIFNGPRVQLLPAYLITLLFAVLLVSQRPTEPSAIRESKEGVSKKLARWSLVLGTGFVLLISIFYCLAFPHVEYPKPSGQHDIGVHEIRLVDPARLEPSTPDEADHRELSIRITYPTDTANSGPYKRDFVVSAAAAGPNAGLRTLKPNTFWATLYPESWGKAQTHAAIDKTVASAQSTYPVLIFSHGLASWPEQYIVVMEELASHGYIVMAINHQSLSGRYVRADGSIDGMAYFVQRQNAIPFTAEQRKKMSELDRQIADVGDDVDSQLRLLRDEAIIRPESIALLSAESQLMSDDQRFVIGALGELQANDPVLQGHLDLKRIGVFGMSLGGSASHITCIRDSHCRAGLNMDGFQNQVTELPPLKVPFMHMSNESNHYALISHQRAAAASYVIRVQGSVHSSYSDFGLVAPLLRQLDKRGISVIGTIEGERMRSIVNDYAVAFFDKHLLDRPEPLLSGPSDRYPEVSFLAK